MAQSGRKAANKNAAKTKVAEKNTPIAGYESIENFTKNGLQEIVQATKSINAFPTGSSRDLYCAYPSFGRVVDVQSDRILGLISKVLKLQNIKGNIQRRQPDEQFEMLLECNDAMLERIGSNLDELAGIKKNPQTIVVESRLNAVIPGQEGGETTGSGAGSWNKQNTNLNSMAARLITAKNIARPQIKFQIPVDNSASAPFLPKLKDKPNSLKPLAILPEYDDAGNIASYLHPYEFELMKFKPPETLFKRRSPVKPIEMTDTELLYVDTVPKLRAAIDEMRDQKEIAIDVEHHSYRTFQGITCLVQISTRSKDYLFDALALREDMHLLNEIFTNPKVVKILHGADLDIEWLQRDLSLYIVNMFDTHQAAKTLNLARLSLAFLLKHYCDIEADKTYQLADWRMRPLPRELIYYARQDTHFLIYIYERLTNDILDASHNQTNILANIYQRSTEICKKRYVKPTIGPETHLDLFRKSKRVFDNRQMFALREIFAWRDNIARMEDESYGYVLPNHMMLQISESLPREMQGILACCNPIPPLVRQNLHTLHQIVLRAREQPLVKPILETEVLHRIAISNTIDFNSKLYCPHDLSHCEEFRDDLPTLLNFKDNDINSRIEQSVQEEVASHNTVFCKPACSVFDTPANSEDEDVMRNLKKLEQIQFISPYERYLAMLPIAEKEKREEAARIEAENKKRQLCPDAPTLLIKQEPTEATPTDEVDELYSLPIKEMLKRKYEESVAKKAAEANFNSNSEVSKAKRMRIETPNDDKLKFVNIPQNKKAKNQSRDIRNTQTQNTTPNSTQRAQNDDDNGDDDEAPVEMPSTSAAFHQTQQQQQQRQGAAKGKQRFNNKNKKLNKFKARKNSIQNQSSDKPVQQQQTNFDYQKVDFKKFQGGAKRAAGAELKPQFHGKGNSNKANNKKFNKLFTFSNVKGKK